MVMHYIIFVIVKMVGAVVVIVVHGGGEVKVGDTARWVGSSFFVFFLNSLFVNL